MWWAKQAFVFFFVVSKRKKIRHLGHLSIEKQKEESLQCVQTQYRTTNQARLTRGNQEKVQKGTQTSFSRFPEGGLVKNLQGVQFYGFLLL